MNNDSAIPSSQQQEHNTLSLARYLSISGLGRLPAPCNLLTYYNPIWSVMTPPNRLRFEKPRNNNILINFNQLIKRIINSGLEHPIASASP